MRILLACGTMALVGCVMEAGTELAKDSPGAARPAGVFGGLVSLVGGVDISGVTTNSNTNDNGAGNSNDNGADNGNDNGAGNTNDNGADNGNDNGAGNTNDNGADNGNDNGAGNTNDNGSAGDLCPDGSLKVRAELTDGSDGEGRLDFRVLPGGCMRFRARVDEGLPPGDHEVAINDIVVGHIMIDSRGRGELEFDSEDGTFPAGFPNVAVGDVGDIGGVLVGTFALNCSAIPQTCNANGNDNGAGNTNDNGAGNTNDNGG